MKPKTRLIRTRPSLSAAQIARIADLEGRIARLESRVTQLDHGVTVTSYPSQPQSFTNTGGPHLIVAQYGGQK
jgi:hypothetical protein